MNGDNWAMFKLVEIPLLFFIDFETFGKLRFEPHAAGNEVSDSV